MATTAVKIAANRANATLSTGPADTSRTRFNGLAHGLTSKQTVIPGENQQEYDAFHSDLLTHLAPGSSVENLLAERLIAAAWRLKRFTRVESAFFTNRIDAFLEDNPDGNPNSALANLFIDPAEITRMRLFMRYQNTVQREYDTAMREFHKAKAERARDEFEQAMLRSSRAKAPAQATAETSPYPSPVVAAESSVGFASKTSRQVSDGLTNAA